LPPPSKDELTLVEDAAQVRSALRGDRRAWTQLYERYAPAVHACILARVPRADAEDLVQDVFVTALSRLDSLDDQSRFRAWLLSIARNRRTDYWRRHKDTRELGDELTSKQGAKGDAQRALNAIRTLPDTYQETLIMRLVEGMTGPEIAKSLDMTHGSVRVNLTRGMKLLREALDVKEPS
jgi:RNA polymerase sigma-70 factor (ECF subfamily)